MSLLNRKRLLSSIVAGYISDPLGEYVVSLNNFNEVNTKNSIKDERGNVWLPQATGGVITTSVSKFGAGCFDTALGGHFCESAELDVPTGDFTVECFFNATGTPSGTYQPLFNRGEPNVISVTGLQYWVGLKAGPGSSTTNIVASLYHSGGATNIIGPPRAPYLDGLWHHIALVRSGNNFYLFLDGVLSGSANISAALHTGGFTSKIASYVEGGTTYIGFCKIDGYRVTKYARYTSNFAVANSEFPILGPDKDSKYVNVLSFLPGNGANNATVFSDAKRNTWTRTGAVVTSTTKSKFNGSSLYFPANTNLSTPSTSAFDLYNYDFCIEAFINPTAFTGVRTSSVAIVSRRAGGTNGWCFSVYEDGSIGLRANIGGTWNDYWGQSAGGLVLANTWTHVALIRQGNTFYFLVNGVVASSFTNSGIMSDEAQPIRLNTAISGNEGSKDTYIQAFRFTISVPRYSIPFVPPIAMPKGYGDIELYDDFSTNSINRYRQFADSPATWTITGGNLVASGAGIQSLLLFREAAFINGEVSATILQGPDCGLALRVQGNGDYYLVGIHDSGAGGGNANSIRIYRRIGGSFALIQAFSVSIPRGTPTLFTFRIYGNRLEVDKDGQIVGYVVDTNITSIGLAGLRHYDVGVNSIFQDASIKSR